MQRSLQIAACLPAVAHSVIVSNLPVLLWLHPGGFRECGAALHGPESLMDRDRVLVTLKARLGALGFLIMEDGASAAN